MERNLLVEMQESLSDDGFLVVRILERSSESVRGLLATYRERQTKKGFDTLQRRLVEASQLAAQALLVYRVDIWSMPGQEAFVKYMLPWLVRHHDYKDTLTISRALFCGYCDKSLHSSCVRNCFCHQLVLGAVVLPA